MEGRGDYNRRVASPRSPALCALTLLGALVIPLAAPASTDEEPALNLQDEYFSAVDLKDDGDCVGAIALFRFVLSQDPSYHQARLHLADCLHQLGRDDEALEELGLYVAADFPGAEIGKARVLVAACGGDPDAIAPSEAEGDEPVEVPSVAPPPPGFAWTPLGLEAGCQAEHAGGDRGTALGGPLIGARFLPWRYVEAVVHASLGFDLFRDRERSEVTAAVGVGALASIPVGTGRVTVGVVGRVGGNALPGESAVTGGAVGEVGLRLGIPASRVVIGVALHGGYVGHPVMGGGLRVGLQVGPRR